MPWWVLRSPAGKMGVIYSVIRPSQAVGEPFEDYGEAIREKGRRAVEEMKEGRK